MEIRYNAGSALIQQQDYTETKAGICADWGVGVHEDELIERIGKALGRRPPATSAVRLGIGDDAALFRPQAGNELILTCDWFVEGTHFLREMHSADSVGWKCLARAVSDIAAMGGVPRCALLSLALPASHTGRWLDEFLGGLHRASQKLQCALAGGDTTRRSEILVNVMVAGEVQRGRAVFRSGARPGELIYVSGRLGEAELGLQIIKHTRRRPDPKNPLTKKHFYPQPRLALGQWLAKNRLAAAMMDISDGLSSDLPRLCAASGVGADVESAKIPRTLSLDAARKYGLDPAALALHGGDDYELLFTVSPGKSNALPHVFQSVMLTRIGKVTRGSNLVLRDEGGRERPLRLGGWDPFRSP